MVAAPGYMAVVAISSRYVDRASGNLHTRRNDVLLIVGPLNATAAVAFLPCGLVNGGTRIPGTRIRLTVWPRSRRWHGNVTDGTVDTVLDPNCAVAVLVRMVADTFDIDSANERAIQVFRLIGHGCCHGGPAP